VEWVVAALFVAAVFCAVWPSIATPAGVLFGGTGTGAGATGAASGAIGATLFATLAAAFFPASLVPVFIPVDFADLLGLAVCALFVEVAACVFVAEFPEVVSAAARAAMRAFAASVCAVCAASICAKPDSSGSPALCDLVAAVPGVNATPDEVPDRAADCDADWFADFAEGNTVSCAAFALADINTLPKPSLTAPDCPAPWFAPCAALMVAMGAEAVVEALAGRIVAFMPLGAALLPPNSRRQS
jgi:hypothetical protein